MSNLLSIHKAAEYLDVTEDCLRKWDAANKLKPLKTAGGHRRYRKEDLDKMIGIEETKSSENKPLSQYTNEELLKELKKRMH